MEDLVFQLTIALQLKGENIAFSRPTVRKRKRMKEWLWINILLNRLQTGHKNLKGQSVATPVLEALQVTMTTIDTTPICIHFYTENIVSVKIIIHIKCASEYTNTCIHHLQHNRRRKRGVGGL